jgi:hypothetical protein
MPFTFSPAPKGTRINLHIHVNENGKQMYQVLHLGFFPTKMAVAVARKLDARTIAFHTTFPHQVGRVDVVTCAMAEDNADNLRFATYEYQPRRVPEAVDA